SRPTSLAAVPARRSRRRVAAWSRSRGRWSARAAAPAQTPRCATEAIENRQQATESSPRVILSPVPCILYPNEETPPMLQSVLRALQLPDLRRRILFTLGMLLIFRLIAHIPVPNIDPSALASLQQALKDNQLAQLLNIFAGGALQNLSVAAMGVYPYITAQIIVQLLQPLIPALEQLGKEGEQGRMRMNRITFWATVPLAYLQAYGQTLTLTRGATGGAGLFPRASGT